MDRRMDQHLQQIDKQTEKPHIELEIDDLEIDDLKIDDLEIDDLEIDNLDNWFSR